MTNIFKPKNEKNNPDKMFVRITAQSVKIKNVSSEIKELKKTSA